MNIRRVGWSVMIALAVSAQTFGAATPTRPAPSRSMPAPADQLSVMSYNVHGLPWPLAERASALGAIASQLRDLRAAGRQPHVVVLQEAFTSAAKAIGGEAGYRYAQFGPGAETPAVPGSPADAGFQAAASHASGEADGKWVDSGLVIFSDYPIVASRRIAYPVCAGFDCLANKGALAVAIRMPGIAQPVYVVGTHLNSKRASGVAQPRANYAYRRQIALFGQFVDAAVPKGAPLFVAGDFNVGRAPERRAVFSSGLLSSALALAPALGTCERQPACAIADATDTAESARHNKDWLLYRAGAGLAVTPTRFLAPFGRQDGGTMLSDHIGIAAVFRLSNATR